MKLTLEQIRSVTTGAVTVEQEPDGIHFYRFNKEQMACYQGQIVVLEQKILATAGIKLSFRTDSPSLTLGMDIRRRVGRGYYALDVVVNGILVGSLDNFSQRELPEVYTDCGYVEGAGEGTFALGEGEKEVCIHLPWSVSIALRELSLEDGASLIPVIPPKKLLVFGDSITQGYDALRPSNRYIARLAKALNAQEYNKAIGGAVSFPELARARDEFDPDYIVVAFGTNDWRLDTEKNFLQRYPELMAAIQCNYPKAQVFAITPIWRGDMDERSSWGELSLVEQHIRRIVADFPNVTVISGFDLVPHERRWFADLHLHPNDAGFDHYCNNLWPKIKAVLKE